MLMNWKISCQSSVFYIRASINKLSEGYGGDVSSADRIDENLRRIARKVVGTNVSLDSFTVGRAQYGMPASRRVKMYDLYGSEIKR